MSIYFIKISIFMKWKYVKYQLLSNIKGINIRRKLRSARVKYDLCYIIVKYGLTISNLRECNRSNAFYYLHTYYTLWTYQYLIHIFTISYPIFRQLTLFGQIFRQINFFATYLYYILKMCTIKHPFLNYGFIKLCSQFQIRLY